MILRVFHQTRTRPTGVTRRVVSDIQLIIDGEDLTEQVAGQLDRALGLMSPVFAQSPPPPAAPPPRQVPTGPSNAVRERRHSVIRQ
ncbi:hypothetical protein JQS43_14265 [Natronosporangium hydrolyticum]|uniref:Uncharacterized protein n=1 Tax=Natronosporangium hydrolyticum TaxID=2811111 RepID=A0A895Y564_9ACTN|nr:hypothetical protein [Natronosporangium hydrolyticum]QSB12844.1 hypothetical protein JQS43_14265 [Natronosporangium hydrolyticum]